MLLAYGFAIYSSHTTQESLLSSFSVGVAGCPIFVLSSICRPICTNSIVAYCGSRVEVYNPVSQLNLILYIINAFQAYFKYL